MFVPIVQRQRNVLNLTYWHAVILVHRPFLLRGFVGSRGVQAETEEALPVDDQLTEDSVQQCVSSAMKTVNAINQMTQSRQMSRAFWVFDQLPDIRPHANVSTFRSLRISLSQQA